MVQQSLNVAYSDGSSQVLWEDGERVFSRGWRLDDNGNRLAVLLVAPAADHPSRSRLDRLTHEYELKDELDRAWAARPLALMRDAGRIVLVLDDVGGEPLDRLLGGPMEVGRFLRLAIAVTSALGKLHQRGLVHKDIKPANILANSAMDHVWLTGFGIASRLPRERQSPEAPEFIAGTLAYMAPEQTGRMNRSIDARSDLYALGVTLYQMLTGVLPLTAADPMEWVHCHIARKPMPPGERLDSVPVPVSAIIMKLLAKTPEDRYQTAGGVERDLRRCLAEWEARRRINDFPLGLQDTPNQLLIPEKLYGRDREIAMWSQDIPASASPQSSTNCTRRWCSRAACSRPASSTSTSAISLTRHWCRLFKASSGLSSAKATPSWRAGATRFWRRWGRTGGSWSTSFPNSS